MKKKPIARPRYIMEGERNRVQGNRVISTWKVQHGHYTDKDTDLHQRWNDLNVMSKNSVKLFLQIRF